jgi:hypothetical protein
MRRSILFFAMGFLALQNAYGVEMNHKIACDIVEEDDKIIRCTYSSTRLAHDRTIRFVWRSETTPQDDRERTFVLPARYGSVYDYRYFYGRAPGLWRVEARDENGDALAETTFTLE